MSRLDETPPLLLATEDAYLDGTAQPETRLREFLTFLIGDETYGLDLRCLREIMRLPELTELPRAPAFLRGILSLRGTMVPVIDMRSRLRLGRSEPTVRTRVLVVDYAGDLVGLIVDSVTDVARIAEEDIEAPPSSLGNQDVTHIVGIGRYHVGAAAKSRIVVLLSLESLMHFDLVWGRRRAS